MRRLTVLFAVGLLTSLASLPFHESAAADDDAAKQAFFESRIRPVLVSKCYECHSAQSGEAKGGLLLDTRQGMRSGGDSGHAVVPGNVQESLVLSAIKYESFEMPPDQRLPKRVIDDFETWIRMGAADPREGQSTPAGDKIDFETARQFWSFQPIRRPDVPSVSDPSWLRSEIDAFIAAKMQASGLRPVEDADGITLARRIHFDLIGMQPSPEDATRFAAEYSKDADAAIESLVDRLLDSRHFGERWGRHWMDVVRYAESTGMERNGTYPQAWRYRDWVIDALNRDKPYNDFVGEQIAGDLLPYDSSQRRQANLIATGFLAIGPKSLNEPNKEKFRMDVVDEQIDVVSRAFLGLTASCARCHDHKFDPIPQSEYYALAGIFTSTETLYGTGKTNGNRNPGRVLAISGDNVQPIATGGGNDDAKLRRRYQAQLKIQKTRLASYQKQIGRAKNEKSKAGVKRQIARTNLEIRKLNNRIKQVSEPEVKPSADAKLVMGVVDGEEISGTRLRIRGEPTEYGSAVPRGFLTIASLGESPPLGPKQSGRRELAEWITDSDNPLTARVMVNRVWQHLFGQGIVSTVNNFGANGDRPTHPLLLDHLASHFLRDGGSIKRLIRRIMLSRVYRLSSLDDSANLAADPDNDLLWRMNQRRLEAEAIRDAMLVAAGQIDLAPAQASVVAQVGNGIVGRNVRSDQLLKNINKRSVYLPIVRGALPEMLRIFDFPEPSIIGGVRDVTTVPTQALYMMNNGFVFDCATNLAERLLDQQESDADRVRLAYQLTLTRQPTQREVQIATRYIDETNRMLEKQDNKSTSQAANLAWASFCQSLLASSEFRYVN